MANCCTWSIFVKHLFWTFIVFLQSIVLKEKVVIGFNEKTSSTSMRHQQTTEKYSWTPPHRTTQPPPHPHSLFVELRGTLRRHNPAAPATVLKTGQSNHSLSSMYFRQFTCARKVCFSWAVSLFSSCSGWGWPCCGCWGDLPNYWDKVPSCWGGLWATAAGLVAGCWGGRGICWGACGSLENCCGWDWTWAGLVCCTGCCWEENEDAPEVGTAGVGAVLNG